MWDELRPLLDHTPDTALVHDGELVRRESLAIDSARLADRLARHGVTEGRRVVLLSGNTPGFAAAWLAVMRLRASAVLLSPHLTDGEIGRLVARTRPSAILVDSGLDARVSRTGVAERADSDAVCGRPLTVWRVEGAALAAPGEATALVTSGSTGRAKIVARSAAMLREELESFSAALGHEVGPTVCPAPLFHTYGFVNGLLWPLFSKRPTILIDWFVPSETSAIVARYRPGVFVGVPTMYKTLAEAYGPTAAELASLRYCFSAGAPLPAAVARAFETRFGQRIREQYGATETGVIAADLDDAPSTEGCVGRPFPGREVLIRGDDGAEQVRGAPGDVYVRSPGAANAYLDDPGLSAVSFDAGCYRTGDLGRLDDAGRLTLSGRRATFINVAGLKVDPREVERALAGFDAVADCVVLPAPDPVSGEVVRAVIVPRRAMTTKEVQRFCRGQLAGYKVPRHVEFVSALPRSGTGKLLVSRLIDSH
jgi:long-chain acyl-CoA synthetase